MRKGVEFFTMREFTFVTLSYNQEKYIIQHLESIKHIITKYSNNISIDYILSDDCSSDNTVKYANCWLDYNRDLFSRVVVLKSSINEGIVKNYLKAIKKIRTKKFKDLAADDLYLDYNIFSFDESYDLLVSPVIGFYNSDKLTSFDMYLFEKCANQGFNNNFKVIKKCLEYSNIIPSPGVFLSTDLIKNTGMINFLSKYKWIEDLTQWIYLFIEKNDIFNVHVSVAPVVLYRLSDGITTNANKAHLEFIQEEKEIARQYKLKRYILPKYINPYTYICFFDKLFNKVVLENVYNNDFKKFYNRNSELYLNAGDHIRYLQIKEREFLKLILSN